MDLNPYISSIDRKISGDYDKLLKIALEPYGINKENIKDEGRRVNVIFRHLTGDHFQTSDDFYIDGAYAFSIQKTFIPGISTMKVIVELVKGGNKP